MSSTKRIWWCEMSEGISRSRKVLIAACSIMVSLALCVPAIAGNVAGYIQDPMGVGIYEEAVNCNDKNNSTWGGSVRTPPSGYFSFSGTPGTIHSVIADDHLGWAPTFGLGLANNTFSNKLRTRATFFQYAPNWDINWHQGVAQTFIATGTCILKVTIRIASPTASFNVSIHRGGPTGPQVGPTKSISAGSSGAETAVWQPGEVPTTPGEQYCVKVVRPGGQSFSIFMVDPLVDNGDACPEGCVWWFNGTTWTPDWSQDTGIIIVSDGDDGLLCNMNTGKWGKWGSLTVGYTNYGQTFTARGTGLVSASFTVNADGNYTVALYDYSGGTIGSQIGTSKTLAAGAYVESNGVIWSPGEFPPLTPGNTYYIEIRRQDGGTFGVYRTGGDYYTGGVSFVNRTPQPAYDLASTIYVESAAGEGSKPWVKIGDGWPLITDRSSNSITIYWTTDAASDTRVEYAVGRPPYTATYYDSAMTTNHTAVLTGLSPNTVYHFRVSSARSGYRTAISRDYVGSTLPSGANMIVNPGFETGALSPWVSWSGNVEVHHGEWFWNMPPRSGTYAAQFGQNGGPYTTTGIYQQVSVTPGRWYRVTGWFALFPTENINSVNYLKYDAFGESAGRLMWARIGLDPSGGTNGFSGNIKWCRSAYSFPNPNTFQANQAPNYHYICLSALAKATGSTMTVFVAVDAGGSLSWDCWSIDDFAMSEVPTSDVTAAKTAGSAEQVAISGAVVTAVPAQVGAYYIEDPDRSSGIRVESADSASVGDIVTVFGGIATNADGERTVVNASIAGISGSGVVLPVGMSCGALGGADFEYDGTSGQEGLAGGVGLNNIGLLVRVWGKVVEVDPGGSFFRIDDGSCASDGSPARPKVMLPGGVSAPAMGSMVVVTGISSCEDSGGELRSVVRVRSSGDLHIIP